MLESLIMLSTKCNNDKKKSIRPCPKTQAYLKFLDIYDIERVH